VSEEATVIGEVAKNARERVRVSLTSYEGHPLCDVRVFVQGDVAGVFDRPTKKGLCIRRELVPTLRGLLQKAERGCKAPEPADA
jgi:hypothetical protein